MREEYSGKVKGGRSGCTDRGARGEREAVERGRRGRRRAAKHHSQSSEQAGCKKRDQENKTGQEETGQEETGPLESEVRQLNSSLLSMGGDVSLGPCMCLCGGCKQNTCYSQRMGYSGFGSPLLAV